MAFNKKVWSDGEVLDAAQMNRIETGIDDLQNGNSGAAAPTWEYNVYKEAFDGKITEEVNIPFEWELGTLKDDTSGVAGDKVSSKNRIRMTNMASIDGAISVSCTLPAALSAWVNLYDADGNYSRSPSSSTYTSSFTFKPTESDKFVWIIFRYDDASAAEAPTDAEMAEVFLDILRESEISDEVGAQPELLETISVVAKNAYNLDIQIEGGKIDRETGRDSDSISDYSTWVRSGLLISLEGATKVSFNSYLPVCKSGYVIFYDYSMNVLRSIDLTAPYGVVDLVGDEKYFRVVFNSPAYRKETINITVYNSKTAPKECKKKLWRTDYSFDNITYPVNGDKTICGTVRIFLPPNYSVNGKKVPLIYYLPGSGNWYGWSHPNWPGTNNTLYNGLSYCMNEGFAVCTIYGWGDYYHLKYSPGSSHPYPIKTCLQVIQDGIDWLVSRYNIDGENIHVMSKSQGGQNSAYWVSRPFPGLRTVGMCAPVVDYFSMPAEPMYNPPRKCIVEDLNLQGDTDWFSHGNGEYADDPYWTYKERAKEFILLNKNKFAGMNEAWVDLHGGTIEEYIEESWASGREYWGTKNDDGTWTPGYKAADANTSLTDETIYKNADKYTKTGRVPCKLWSGDKDDNTPHWKNVEFIKQLQNGGSDATLRVYPGGHSSFDYGGSNSGTTALGIPYSGVCNYYIENIQFIREYMP